MAETGPWRRRRWYWGDRRILNRFQWSVGIDNIIRRRGRVGCDCDIEWLIDNLISISSGLVVLLNTNHCGGAAVYFWPLNQGTNDAIPYITVNTHGNQSTRGRRRIWSILHGPSVLLQVAAEWCHQLLSLQLKDILCAIVGWMLVQQVRATLTFPGTPDSHSDSCCNALF